ncbi:TIGR02452 family protein [Corallococcus exiguus]|uniref:TIGR02452 family protein n=1 Tax=Corallococcus exiguus TaxID=83462 RepID=A0A7X4Y6F0_9BACT|nr:TIGR02452 family protein [Corallococcus exiguus]NBC39606.1 TIGR02452 family protein [Corallococcus exiguus]TNV60917.1 TIGR02452 family protein [Corallococcus exiguus]
MSLKGIAQETVGIVERGEYMAPSGRPVRFREQVEQALRGTVLYRPGDFARLPRPEPRVGGSAPRIEVTPEKTGAAARRCVEVEGVADLVALNFASAKNPGGGFLGGAKAQEEDLARCSALYPCLLTQREYYDANRAQSSPLYTDHVIYSPQVPFFRDEGLTLLEKPFSVSLITAPAPNAGSAERNAPHLLPRMGEALHARALKVLQVAAHQGHRTVVLGAWGCGAFRNNPLDAADAFARALDAFPGVFERVVFAVWERGGDGPNLRTFRERFA